MEESASPEGEKSIFKATTKWIVGDGSLDNSISFDSYAAPDDEATASTGDVLLLRPEGDDPPPCEITICFKKKHEIRMVYVRSTARVYEVYYASDHNDSSKEYLCTVRCGAAAAEELVISQNLSAGATRSDSNSSDEDGWVEVKTSEACSSSERHAHLMDTTKTQVHYEATAEISDSNPCVSLTLRLLSVLSKDCVHVDEIYVCADPVESSNSEHPVTVSENFGGSSLLSMLVPSLMQISKSETKRNETAQAVSTGVEKNISPLEECSYVLPHHKLEQEIDRAKVKADNVQHETRHGITTNPLQMQNSFADQHKAQAYGRIEKVLDDLVLKVGRVESFCSKFEEKMLEPLNCMEERLQQLEQKLDALVLKSQPSELCPCSWVSENRCGNTKHTGEPKETSTTSIGKAVEANELVVPECYYTGTGLVMKAPEFANDDGGLVMKAPEFLNDDGGLVIKAPEFLNDDCESSSAEDTLDPSIMGGSPKKEKLSSIDSALALSLAAFLSSSGSIKSSNPVQSTMSSSQVSVIVESSTLDSFLGLSSAVEGGNRCDMIDATTVGDSSFLTRDATPVHGKLNISDLNDKSFDKLDVLAVYTTNSDDSLSVAIADVSSPTSVSQLGSVSLVTSPRLLNGDITSNTSDDISNCPEDHTCPTLADRETIPLPAKFLSSGLLPTIVTSSVDSSNELSASVFSVPSDDGADEVGSENQDECGVKDEVALCLEDRLIMSPSNNTMLQEDGDRNNSFPVKTVDDAHFVETLDRHMLIDLNEGVINGGHTDSNAAEKGKDLLDVIDQIFATGWTKYSSSISSSLHEMHMKNIVETEWSDLVTEYSNFQPASNNCEGELASDLEKVCCLTDHTRGITTTTTIDSSADWGKERANVELEDITGNVKFVAERNWKSGLPPELMAGEMKDSEPSDAAISCDDEDDN